jgi:hypothetical protein
VVWFCSSSTYFWGVRVPVLFGSFGSDGFSSVCFLSRALSLHCAVCCLQLLSFTIYQTYLIAVTWILNSGLAFDCSLLYAGPRIEHSLYGFMHACVMQSIISCADRWGCILLWMWVDVTKTFYIGHVAQINQTSSMSIEKLVIFFT